MSARPRVYVTRHLPGGTLDVLRAQCELEVWEGDDPPPSQRLREGAARAHGILTLLTDRIDLLRDTTVVAVFADDIYVSVAVEEKQAMIGTTRLMMMFGAKDFALKQWVVTDPQGYDTTVALSNIDSVRRPDPSLFKIDYTQYPN